MKKLMLFLSFIGYAKTNLGSIKYTSPEYQDSAKKTCFSKDGISLYDLEQSMRQKYNKISIPSIAVVNDVSIGYVPLIQKIFINKSHFSDYSATSNEWALLHETGHGTENTTTVVSSTTLGSLCATSYFWGMHKKIPYKNIATKLASKTTASLALNSLIYCYGARLDEKHADSFANKYADQAALQGGIDIFKSVQKSKENKYNQFKYSNIIPFQVFEFLKDPLHPSLNSRITNIQNTLKTRFNVAP